MSRPLSRSITRERGFALALLVWMIAALSLMAGGIVMLARTDMQLAQLQTRELQAVALGDGAARLLLRDLIDLQNRGEYLSGSRVIGRYELGGQTLVARVQPSAGLIDINAASDLLWLDMLQFGAGLSEEEARQLLENLLLWKQPPPQETGVAPVRAGQFLVVEDLLLVPGMTREIFEQLRPLIHTYSKGGGGISLMSASAPVVQVLARGDHELASRFIEERTEDPLAYPYGYPGLTPEHLGQPGTSVVRIEVRVVQPDGSALLHQRWVDTGDTGRDGLPWRFLRAEPVILVKGNEFED